MTGSKTRYRKTFPISWEQLHRDSRALAWRLVDMQPWEGLVTITRGGLVPASIIARTRAWLPIIRPLQASLLSRFCANSFIKYP